MTDDCFFPDKLRQRPLANHTASADNSASFQQSTIIHPETINPVQAVGTFACPVKLFREDKRSEFNRGTLNPEPISLGRYMLIQSLAHCPDIWIHRHHP